MNEMNVLLFIIILQYSIPIALVMIRFRSHRSISSIICHEKNRAYILASMIFMGITCVLYEIYRKDFLSLFLIVSLLLSIYALILVNENFRIHYVYALIAFLSIMGFMFHHCIQSRSALLYALLFIQIMNGIMLLQKWKRMFIYQVLFLFTFAIYYFCLHCMIDTR